MTDRIEDQDARQQDSKGELLLRDQIKAAMEETRTKDAPSTGNAADTRPPPTAEPPPNAGDRPSKIDAAAQAAPKDATSAKTQVKAPARWSSEAKTKFANLDPDLQKEILQRETEIERATRHLDEERALGRQIREMSAPYEAILRAENATPALAYRDYLNTAYQLRTASPQQKSAMLLALARQFNVPLPSTNGAAQTAPAFDTGALGPMIRDTVNQEFAHHLQRRDVALAHGEIDAFGSDPSHAHLDHVAPIMAGLLRNGRAKTLEEAYDQACWSMPELRANLLAQAEQKRLGEQKAKTDAAKRASGSVTGAPGNAAPLNGSGAERSLRDELRANLRAAQGRI